MAPISTVSPHPHPCRTPGCTALCLGDSSSWHPSPSPGGCPAPDPVGPWGLHLVSWRGGGSLALLRVSPQGKDKARFLVLNGTSPRLPSFALKLLPCSKSQPQVSSSSELHLSSPRPPLHGQPSSERAQDI